MCLLAFDGAHRVILRDPAAKKRSGTDDRVIVGFSAENRTVV